MTVFLSVAAGLLWSNRAKAHLVTTGMGPVYDGIGHLLLTPEDLIPVVALAMYCGLQGARHGRYLLFILPLCWFAGGLLGLAGSSAPEWQAAGQAGSFLLIGMLVAADVRLPVAATGVVALLVGSAHGFLNGIALHEGPAALGLLGIMAALFVLVSLVSALVVSIRIPWLKIVVRVLGSWVAASGMLMAGWYLKGTL